LFHLKFDGNGKEEISGETYNDFDYETVVNGQCGRFNGGSVQIPNTIWKQGPKKLKFDFYVSRYGNNEAGEPILASWGGGAGSTSSRYFPFLLGTIDSSDKLDLYYNGGTKAFSMTMTDNKWYHIQIELTTMSITCYVNGVNKCNKYATTYRDSNLYICYKRDTGTSGHFLIDDFKIYDIT
jgi:hypothetical protein